MRTKTRRMTQSFNQYSENETKIWHQNILNQFNRVIVLSSFSFRSLSIMSKYRVSKKVYMFGFDSKNLKLDYDMKNNHLGSLSIRLLTLKQSASF